MDRGALVDVENRIGVGIVGFGKIAQDQHVAAIRESRRFFLHAVADHRECATSVHNHPDVETMLAAQDPPVAIAICTPPQVRFGIACDVDMAPLRLVTDALKRGGGTG